MLQSTTDTQATRSESLSTSVMLRYGIGQTGAQMFRDIPAALLPVFMTTMLGIPAWIGGLVILLPKIWVIFCDPLMGAWSDRRAGTVGRTPFLVAGAVSTGIGFFALFTFTGFDDPMVAAAAVSFLFLLAMTGFSAFSVPYLAIAASLSRDPYERTKLIVYRLIFTSIGIIIGVGFAQPAVFWFGGGATGWSAMAALFGAICFVTMFGSAVSLHPVLKARQGPVTIAPSLKDQFIAAWRNRPFRQLTIIHFIQTIATAGQYTVLAMVFIYLVGRIELLPVFVFMMSGVGILMQPIWLRVSRRFGKLRLFVILCLVWCLITLSWFGIDWGAGQTIDVPLVGTMTMKEFYVVLRGGAIGMTNAGFIMLVTALFTDTIYLGEEAEGAALEGSYAGLWSASEKLAFALGPVLAGTVLSLYGFQSSKSGPIAQSADALQGILLNYSIIPIVIFLASLCLVPAFARSMKAAEAKRL